MASSLKIKRIQQDLTQEALAKKVNIPQWRISLLERGIIPRPDEMKRLKKILNLPDKG